MEEGSETEEVIVIADTDGNRYLIRREVLEQGKVMGDQVAEIDALMEGDEDDVSGFVFERPRSGFSLRTSARQFSVVNTFSVQLAPSVSSFQISDAMRSM